MPSLEDKITTTEAFLTDLARKNPETTRVAWTGGKDSTTVLFIWKSVLEHLGLGPARVISIDTGQKFPEIIDFRDSIAASWGLDLHIARPETDLATYPVALDHSACCADLKILPLQQAIRETGTTALITGIRHDEHPDRAGRLPLEQRLDPTHTLANPILDWTETDIWAFADMFALSRCSLYAQGYRSLGCVPCTQKSSGCGERSGRDSAKEENLAQLTSLGYF